MGACGRGWGLRRFIFVILFFASLAAQGQETLDTILDRGYVAEWRALRARVLKLQPECPCGAKATDVDHVISLRAGGTNDLSNLQALCHSCHSRKTGRHDARGRAR